MTIVVAGFVASILAIESIANPPAVYEVGTRRDFAAGPIHGTGAITQWIVAGGETLESVSIRPAAKTAPHDLRFRARLIDDEERTLAASQTSVDQVDGEGWVRIDFPPTPLVTGRRYGVRLSVVNSENEYLHLDATNHRRIGWGPITNGGLDVNGTMYPAQAIQMRVEGAGGLNAALRMLTQAARGAPDSAVALAFAGMAWFFTVIALILRLPASKRNPWIRMLALAAAVSVTVGTELVAVAWLLG
ncbi:MAG: hypothetical protein QF609_00645 [Gammaproteobacteria bacterium]|nr:hypothetical protein [Gammaproteobacteria bacterium]